jgi:hypothetical protein
MSAEVPGIIARAIDQRGFSTAQELSAHKIHSGR